MGRVTPPAERLVYGRVFDSLFAHGLRGQVTQRLSARLANELGVHLGRRMNATYPVADWERAVGIAAEELHAEVPRERAFDLLGEALTRGYFRTALGELARATMCVLGPSLAVRRIAHAVSTANNYTESRLVERTPSHVSVFVNEPGPLRDTMCGAIRHALETAGGKHVRCAVVSSDDSSTRIDIEWAR